MASSKTWSWPEFLLGAGAVGIIAWAMWPSEAMASLGPVTATPHTFEVTLAPGATKILRVSKGDVITVTSPPGWGPPSANANIPGFLTVTSADPAAESTTLKVTDGGQGQIQMQFGSEVAILSIEVLP